jgi:hypothetical protein
MQTRLLAVALVVLFGPASVDAQSTASADSTPPLTAAQDHQRLLDLLHITALRPGVSHDETAPNPVNFDESKANPWPNLPNPLVLKDGKPVTTAKAWWTQRRPELLELFDREVLGRVPANVPAVHWRVQSTTTDDANVIPAITRHLIGHVDNSADPSITVDIEADLTLPAKAKAPVPVVIEFTFEKYPVDPNKPPAKPAPPDPRPSWKQQVMAKGWGYALLYPTTIQADNGAGLSRGIIGLTAHGQPRKVDDWGTLRAWAWGGSRLVDYFETLPEVDAKHIAVEGHSRFGKTALVAMAYDPRFVVAYVSSAGAGGSALARHRFGEQLENVAGTGEYHWMAGNYLKYAEHEPREVTPDDMPVDTHELIALCAPRPVFIGGGATTAKGDGWADTRGSFLAEVGAGPVYRLLGAKGLIGVDGRPTSTYPEIETALIAGDLGFRQHSEGHTPVPNWPTFLEFASRYMGPSTRGNTVDH